MRQPTWLQELRELLALRAYDARQRALETWEARWVVDVYAVHILSEAEVTCAKVNLIEAARHRVQYGIGQELSKLMGVVSTQERDYFGQSLEVRGAAWAIRREPKADD